MYVIRRFLKSHTSLLTVKGEKDVKKHLSVRPSVGLDCKSSSHESRISLARYNS